MEFTPQTALAQDVHATKALSVRRRFTTPGVHPFDTVEWELRDARIGHGDKVAFEQNDVEFPTTWSQNATNIVAQKYFRGQLELAGARALGQADDRPRRRHDRRLGPRARLLRDGRGRRRLRGRAHLRPAAPDGGLQLAGLVQRRLRGQPRSARPASSSPSTTRWSRSSTGTPRKGRIFRGGSGSGINLSNIRGSMEPLSKGGTRVRAGLLHARRRRVGRHDQVRRQDAPRGEDGRARRRPPGHPRVHLVQGQGGGQGRRAARRRLRHVDRRRRLPLDPVPERQQLGPRHRRVHARRRERRGLAPDRPHDRRAGRRADPRARADARDRRGGVALRRSGRPVRHDDQPVAHVAELGAHQRVATRAPSTCTSTTRRATSRR